MSIREEVIAAAKEAGIKLVPFVVDGNEYDFCEVEMDTSETLERFYAIAHEAGAASRDAEIAELQRNLANEQARDIHSCHHNCAREGCVNRRLRAELAEARAEIDKWKAKAIDLEMKRDIAVSTFEKVKADRTVAKNALAEQCKHTKTIEQQLAAEQAKNVGLREALEYSIKQVPELATVPGISKAISTPSDTAALEAIVKKASEVMRRRSMSVAWNNEPDCNGPIEMGIRALPAVTLEDLK